MQDTRSELLFAAVALARWWLPEAERSVPAP